MTSTGSFPLLHFPGLGSETQKAFTHMSRALLPCGFSLCECSSFRSPAQALLQHGGQLPPSKQGCCQASQSLGQELLAIGQFKSCNQNQFGSVQFSSVAQSCPTLCDPMDRSTPGLPVHYQLPEFTQTHVH